MAAIAWTDVTDVAPELAGKIGAGAQAKILAVVNVMLNVNEFGGEGSDTLIWARANLAAHLATLARRRGLAGSISSESGAEISRSYAILPFRSLYASTSYGQAYMTLARSLPLRAGLLP